jgi:hypothetical protein
VKLDNPLRTLQAISQPAVRTHDHEIAAHGTHRRDVVDVERSAIIRAFDSLMPEYSSPKVSSLCFRKLARLGRPTLRPAWAGLCKIRLTRQPHKIPTAVFCVIYGSVGGGEKATAVGGMLRDGGDAEAHGDGDSGGGFCFDTTPATLGHSERLLRRVIGQENRQLLSAIPVDAPLSLGDLRKTGRDLRQNSIADLMPPGIVDFLEVVDVCEDEAQRLILLSGFGYAVAKRRIKAASVQQLCQIVALFCRVSFSTCCLTPR